MAANVRTLRVIRQSISFAFARWLPAILVALVTISVASAQDRNGSLPPKPTYLGPPSGIDGPESRPSPLRRAQSPLPSSAFGSEEDVASDVGVDEHLLLPGGSIADSLPPDWIIEPPPQKLSAYKSGFFQKLSLAADWLGNEGDAADLGVTEIETFAQVGLPAPIIEWPLLVTPGFNMAMIRGPTVTDLPSRLYLPSVVFLWL